MSTPAFLRLSVFVAALAMPFAGFAAESTLISSLKGKARQKNGDIEKLLAVGNNLEAAGHVEVASGSQLGIKLSDGSTVSFGPGSVFRLKASEGGAPEITLVKGTVGGTFGSPAPVIRTPAGTLIPESASVLVTYEAGRPGQPGKLSVASVAGTVSVMPVNSTVAAGVVAGQQMNLGGSLSDVSRVKLTPEEIESMKATIAGVIAGAEGRVGISGTDSAKAASRLPDFSMVARPIPPTSPNGEGSTH